MIQQALRPGQKVGKYRLLRLLGNGGFGTVYLAEQRREHTQVAVKVLNISLTQAEDIKNFTNEARMVGLRHPHIVPLLDFGFSETHVPFLVMEYAANGTVRDRHPRGERLALQTVVSYVKQIASALQYAHDHGVIHRDVKPENILIRNDGTLLLSDFGVAKFLEQSVLLSVQTQVGTPTYTAPEQHLGYPCFASDQYALAILVYEWLCGVRPFQGTALGLAVQHMNIAPPSLREHLPTLPEAVERVVLKALAKAPEERFARIEEMAAALSEAVQPAQITGVFHSPLETCPTAALTPSEEIVLSVPASQSLLPTYVDKNTKSARFEPVLQSTDNVVSQRQITSVPHAPPQKLRSTSIKPRRWHRALVLIPLILVLIGAGGIYSAVVDSWMPTSSHGPLTSSTSVKNNQPTTVSTTAQTNEDYLDRTWISQTSGTSQGLLGIAWSGTEFVAVGEAGTILESPDGKTWTSPSSNSPSLFNNISQPFQSVVWSGKQFVVVGTEGKVLTSPDGKNWSVQSSGTSEGLVGVAWSGAEFVVVGYTGTILTSPNGENWMPQTSGTSQELVNIVWSGTEFVAVGQHGTILTSSDGKTWTPQTSGTSEVLEGITWSGKQFVAVGSRRTILTSPDGKTWTVQTSNTSSLSPSLQSVTWTGKQFVAVGGTGYEGTILTSPDGEFWWRQVPDTPQDLCAVAWSGTQVVVVGGEGKILTSTDLQPQGAKG